MLNQQQIKMLFSLQNDDLPNNQDEPQDFPESFSAHLELDTIPIIVNIPEDGYNVTDLASQLAMLYSNIYGAFR